MDIVPIILAGGEGKRMNSPLPKVLHHVVGVPMVVRVIQSTMLLNPCKIIIVVGKHRAIIQETIKEYVSDTSTLCYVEQTNPMGTGHALMCCQDELQKTPDAKCLILSGDVPLIMTNMLKELVNNECKTTLVTTEMKNPFGYGRIVTVDSEFQKIVEEKDASPDEKRIKMVNAGVYCIAASHLLSHLSKLSNKNASQEYYLTDIIEIIRIHEREPIHLHVIHPANQHQIRGVNTQEQLAELEEYIL
jgi:UDP-N-acetylglucosamine diphosphorylase/glucosamine-1-phosphate N-acetyltransferase